MKIKRFFGKDMRSALAEVKDTLGPDAVIMSNKRVNGGVEIMAAFDQEPDPKAKNGNAARGKAIRGGEEKKEAIANSLEALLARQEEGAKAAGEETNDETNRAEPSAANGQQRANGSSSGKHAEASTDFKMRPLEDHDATISAMKSDMSAIRQMLEQQVSGLMWQEIERNEPTRAMLIKKLMRLGFTEQVADQISCFIPEGLNDEQAWEQTLDLIEGQIGTTKNDILSQGGVVALVGPTGVGKTTTIAKLAARYAQMHSPDDVALVTTDTFRIAASEQLQTYARIIGCPIKVAKDADELNAVLLQFRQRKLVLIDTAGMGQRDLRLSEQLATLMDNTRLKIRPYLVLSSTAQAPVQNEIVRQFKKIPLCGCIFTKLDESLSLGEVLSTAINNGLPISYLTDGQQVPEDIHIADAKTLVRKAAENMTTNAEAAPFVPQANASQQL
ncbi:flagellar biosynthesis protein FlhF [Aliidiomarina sedimenti]|uniref:Flagellar biosynthesis protein FlhF n=1 Tax=Aliidiomarina sedimenti TaxID=1933879 RepID=A0ABY0BYZ1_9GAMM|nr:flagellar biosynthesis protein FlhF [Aliidiomarina sedimenti]RUO29911.1 flagellar biosynthesis protein FlhF [Aliidiomarina sedimenti]